MDNYESVCDEKSESVETCNTSRTGKRTSHGRESDVMTMLRLSTHETGPACQCKRLKCFEVVASKNSQLIIRDFNNLSSLNEQSLYLAGLINAHEIKNRRPRNLKKQPSSMSVFTHTKLELLKMVQLRRSLSVIRRLDPFMG